MDTAIEDTVARLREHILSDRATVSELRHILDVDLPHTIGILDTERAELHQLARERMVAVTGNPNAGVVHAFPNGRFA